MQIKRLMKRSAAVLAAGVLSVSLLPVSAFAADSFTAAIQEDIDAGMPVYIESYGAQLEAASQPVPSTGMNVAVTLGDGGRQLLASTGIDFSWLNKAAVDIGVKLDDLNATVVGEVLVNDAHIADLNMVMDLANMVAYFQVPELTDSYAYMSLNTALSEAGIDPAMYSTLLNVSKNIVQYYPTAEQMQTLLSKYCPIVLSGLTNQGVSNASVTAGGISADCTVYEATLDEKGAAAIVQALNDTVATDADLEAVLDNFGTLFAQLGQPVDLYEQIKTAIAGVAQNAAQSDLSSTQYFDLKLYKDAENNFAGFTLEGYDAPGTLSQYMPVIAIKCPKNGDQIGFEASITMQGSAYSITGTGTSADGKLNGTYNVNVGPQAVATITLADVTVDASGNATGSASLQLVSSELTQSDSTLSMLSSFTPVLSWNINGAGQSMTLDLAVLMGGASLGNVTISVAPKEVAGMGAPGMATSYNIEDDTQANSWASALNIQNILGNLAAAGVPESLIQQILGGGSAAPATDSAAVAPAA